MDALTFIAQALPEGSFRLLDIGCGAGHVAPAIARLGGDWCGIDPAPEAVEAACAKGLKARIGSAEALPFADADFDACLFLNSLHHVPVALMDCALREALRVSRRVIIIEPMAEGGLYAALLPIDDETLVRRAAQAAIARSLATGTARMLREEVYIRTETYPSFEVFLQRMIAADSSRERPARERREEVRAAFEASATHDPATGYSITQPMIAQVLAPGFRTPS